MIEATHETEQTLTSNTGLVGFDSVDLRTASAQCFNGWLNYNTGAPQFNIVAGGYYEITFNANVTGATAATPVALALYADGVKLNGTEVDEVIVAAGNYHNVAFTKKIRVCGRGNVTLTVNSVPAVVYAGTSTATQTPIVKNANISIERLA